ncbi:SAM-dependent methyltransferase [Pedobacter africanus]|uniref:SAM-dependent methyltransferase n=1 Tax=Pedobacter africanus TaxID=151894 RepID=A0ACC6KTE8_9SPHI|nr:class I SAM-dependent methyltransferase [Pedobacter africanus]MDR6782408.1 SAM-dependent methyltransferase [Pedobacter africanus]
MESYLRKDIIGWDTENWSRALPFWESFGKVNTTSKECLEIGAYGGGLSLWLALNKNKVVCSNLNKPDANTQQVHRKYKCHSNIQYEAIDATAIPYTDQFDYIVFKSILGGINDGDPDIKVKVINEMYKSLKPGGKLLFAENLDASIFHKILRRWFGTKNWNYLKLSDVGTVFSSFAKLDYTTIGFFGCMGRNEYQRIMLGKLDRLFDAIIPSASRYIIIGVATK